MKLNSELLCYLLIAQFCVWNFFYLLKYVGEKERKKEKDYDIDANLFLSLMGNGLDRTRRTWKPNVQEKRLFSYVLDRHIRVKVTTHALRCIDKAGGIDEYLLKTPYRKMDTEIGLLWKAKIEKLYEELGNKEVVFFSPEDEAKFEQGFKDLKLSEREARKEVRRKMYAGISKHKLIEVESKDDEGGTKIEEEISHDSSKQLFPVSYVLAADKLKPGSYVSN